MGERDDLDGFWLFEGLEEEPYGLLPLVNLSAKGGPTSTKYVDRFVYFQPAALRKQVLTTIYQATCRVGSYQWYLNDDTPTILVPGMPTESFYYPGGKLSQDHGVVIYDVNHLKVSHCRCLSVSMSILSLSDPRRLPRPCYHRSQAALGEEKEAY